MQRDAVTQVAHDIVPVGPEADDDGSTAKGQGPRRYGRLVGDFAGAPDEVDGCEGADSAVGKWLTATQGSCQGRGTDLETSLAPCVKEAVAAVRTWRNEYMYSARLSKCAARALRSSVLPERKSCFFWAETTS